MYLHVHACAHIHYRGMNNYTILTGIKNLALSNTIDYVIKIGNYIISAADDCYGSLEREA